jgi:hypothetical protein
MLKIRLGRQGLVPKMPEMLTFFCSDNCFFPFFLSYSGNLHLDENATFYKESVRLLELSLPPVLMQACP